jgi:hypothetical protein
LGEPLREAPAVQLQALAVEAERVLEELLL